MKKILITIGLAQTLALPLFAGETLRLKLEPDRSCLLNGSPQEVVIKIDLGAADARKKLNRTPLNLAVVLDRSGSMSGPKIEKARQAAMGLVDRLGPDDVFSLVAYDENIQVLVSAQHVENKEALKERIARIQPGGSTALYGGVKTGGDQLREYFSSRRINRIILLSDGLANVGPSSTAALRHLGNELSHEGIAVTTIGVGDDYNEDLMAGLAEASDANYYYVKDTEKLPEIFARELGELLTVAAREVRIEILCPRGVEPIGFIGRAEKFENQKAIVRLSQFNPGQNRYLFLRCLIRESQPEIAQVKVSYVDELDGGRAQTADGVVKIRFTNDRALADKSTNPALIAERELMLTAAAKDQALAFADAGNCGEAARKLDAQACVLEAHCAAAAPSVQVQIRNEVVNLRNRSQELQQGQYDATSRKTMQWESYQMRNSK